jgi:hypothetical protein
MGEMALIACEECRREIEPGGCVPSLRLSSARDGPRGPPKAMTFTELATLPAFAALALVACDRPRQQATSAAPSASHVPSSYAPSSAWAEPPSAPAALLESIAFFGKDDVLTLCMDVEVTPMADAGSDWRERFLHRPLPKAKDASKLVKLQKLCGQQFADRHALARCAFPSTCGDAGYCTASILTYYRVDLLRDSDLELEMKECMKDCIEHQGTWQAVRGTSR